MRKINAIIRLVNCMRKIDVDKYQKLCEETYLLALDIFPFMMVNTTLHRIMGHSFKKMRKFGNRGLVSTN